MHYLSDDENEQELKELTLDEEFPMNEMDEETRQIIFGTQVGDVELNDLVKIKVKKITKEKSNKDTSISLHDFIKKNEPKKWTSSRNENKKSKDGKKEKFVKRQFNPRLPPYKLIDRSKLNQKITNDEFKFPIL